ncbi:MAG: DUF559 domain-containing protein [Chloroflexota bacterium]
MSRHGEVLVAIIDDMLDFARLRKEHWYRIPVKSVEKWLEDGFPPDWIAFYQTKIFGEQGNAVNYVAQVREIRKVPRRELFPNEAKDYKSSWLYYQIFVGNLQPHPRPIISRKKRRIHFIPTTIEKFRTAEEINDLFDESPLEDLLWVELKKEEIPAERQEFIDVDEKRYALDFAVYCKDGKINIETDGNYHHTNPEDVQKDKHRANDLATKKWGFLRFTTEDIHERMPYCVDKIKQTIDGYGGLKVGRFKPRRMSEPKEVFQPSFFDFMEED